MTRVLKKGDKSIYENYRPVSCLPAAGKLLEMLICEQVENHMERNELIPETQHSFRRKRSTQTAWSQIQQDWAKNSENNLATGVLMWDLSAAFDTLDHQILLSKLKIYRHIQLNQNEMLRFLNNSKISDKISKVSDMNTLVDSL